MRKVITLIFLSILFCGQTFSAPARRNPITITQSDGTSLTIILRGDEHFSYHTTVDGILLSKNASGDYCYGEIDEDGEITSSNLIAHNLEQREEKEVEYIKNLNSQIINRRIASVHSKKAKARKRTTGNFQPFQTAESPEIRIPVILVQFTDLKFTEKEEEVNQKFNRRLNETNYKEDDYYGSVRDYFASQSNGTFIPLLDVIGPITTENEVAYYGQNNDANFPELVKEVCLYAKENNLISDFSIYANNNSNEVDMVYIIYAGYGANWDGVSKDKHIWPHMWDLTSAKQPVTIDNVKISTYACSNEIMPTSYIQDERGNITGVKGEKIEGIGVLCHEFSHCLGLPDFYDTEGENFGMDVWSLMDAGCYNNNGFTPCGYTAYELDFLGWGNIETLEHPGSYTLEPINESRKAYCIYNPTDKNEYFILENRQKTGWNEKMDDQGLMITHVHYSSTAWDKNKVNVDTEHQRMTIVPADGSAKPESVANDLYPYTYIDKETKQPLINNSFTSVSNPTAIFYDETFMEQPVTNIQEKDGIITFNFITTTSVYKTTFINNARISTSGSTLIIDTEKESNYRIYSLDGVLKYNYQVTPGENRLQVNEGIYIIKSDNQSQKVVVTP